MPEKFKTPIVRESSSTTSSNANSAQLTVNSADNKPEIETESPKLSVSDMAKNLASVLVLGANNPRATQLQKSNLYKVEEPVPEPVEPKRDPRDIVPLEGREKMPTFQESK